MRNKILAVLVGIPMLASTSQAIAQPKAIPQTEKQNIPKIEQIVETKINDQPTQDEIAQKQIAERQAELAKQAQAENLKNQQEQAQAQVATTAAAQTAQKAVTQAVSYNVEQWRSIVAKYPWPVGQAMLVLSRESHGNPNAVSATDDYGLFQIHHGLEDYGQKIFDPEFNVWLAYNQYYKTRGWRPWYSVQGILW